MPMYYSLGINNIYINIFYIIHCLKKGFIQNNILPYDNIMP